LNAAGDRAGGTLLVHLALLAVTVFWGLNFLVTKLILAHWNPLGFVALRFSIMAVLALAWAASAGSLRRIERRDWAPLIIAGITGITLYQLCFIYSLERTTVFASSLLASVFPIFTMIGARLTGDEQPSRVRWLGAFFALGGVAVFEGIFAGRAAFRPGDLLALSASLMFAPYTIIVRRLRERYSPVTLLAYPMAIGTVVLAILGIGPAIHQPYGSLSANDWLLFLYVVIFPILLGYAILNWAIARIGAGPASMYAFGVPIVGGLASAVVLHAPVTTYEIEGAAICLAGLAIAQINAGGRRSIAA
jgi:drug/metabolite transporter (DMT)-like permease